MVVGVMVAAISGLVQYIMTGGIAGWTPLISGVIGAVLAPLMLWAWYRLPRNKSAYIRGVEKYEERQRKRIEEMEKAMSSYPFLGKPEYDPKAKILTFPVRRPERTCKHCLIDASIWLFNHGLLPSRVSVWLWTRLGWKVRETNQRQ